MHMKVQKEGSVQIDLIQGVFIIAILSPIILEPGLVKDSVNWKGLFPDYLCIV